MGTPYLLYLKRTCSFLASAFDLQCLCTTTVQGANHDSTFISPRKYFQRLMIVLSIACESTIIFITHFLLSPVFVKAMKIS